jgi:c(7)-type cytochrome triheme protein
VSHRRWTALALAGVLAGLALLAVGASRPAVPAAPAPPPLPADFPMPKAEGSPGQVTFSHTAHRARVEKCTSCHMRDFAMKRGGSGPITLAAKMEGKLCGACHDGQTSMGGVTVFAIEDCARCHR